MSYTAKSVILDIADNWGDAGYIGLRSVDFWYDGSKITNISATDFVAYSTSSMGASYAAAWVFDTSSSKIGVAGNTSWLATTVSNQRLICVFNSDTDFDEIRVNNYHANGYNSTRGVQNVKIHTSTDAITSTVYNEAIANSTLIYDSTFDQHTGSNVEDEQILTPYFDGIFPSQEICFNLSESSTHQISLPSQDIIFTPGVTGGVYSGAYITSQEISFTTGAESDLQLNIDAPDIEFTPAATATPTPAIPSQSIEFAAAATGGVFAGVFIVQPEITFTPAGESDLQLSIYAPEATFTSGASDAILISLGSQDIAFTPGMGDPVLYEFTTVNTVIYYLFTLTGSADSTTDIEIPISSFQCRMRSGDPTYLSLVIPGVDYADDITARSNGTLKIDMAYKRDGVYLQRETIVQADLENVSLDEGENSASITLTGHKTETFSGKAITLEKSMYRSAKDGKIRHRLAKPNIDLRPGDTVTVGGDTFVADTVSYAISVDSKTMEVAEA